MRVYCTTVDIEDASRGWDCECGAHHDIGIYEAAHWHEALVHTCRACGAVHEMRSGIIWRVKKGKPALARKEAQK